MWQNKVNGILGIWVVALPFLKFSESMHRVLLVLTGLTIVVVAFLGRFIIRSPEDMVGATAKQQNKESENTDLKQDQL